MIGVSQYVWIWIKIHRIPTFKQSPDDGFTIVFQEDFMIHNTQLTFIGPIDEYVFIEK